MLIDEGMPSKAALVSLFTEFCLKSIEILHVRLSCFCQSLLLILYFQTLGQFKNDIVYEFVVGQRIP